MIEYYDSAFKPSRFSLWLTGMRPFKSHIKPIVYFFIATESLGNILTIISLLYDKTFMDIVDIIVTLVLNFNVVIRMATLLYYETEFQNVFQDMEKLWPITNPELHRMLRNLNYFQTLLVVQLWGCCLASFMYSYFTGERALHFYRPELIPEILFVIFIGGCYIFTCSIWLGLDMIFLTITTILMIQYKIFNDKLQDYYTSKGQEQQNMNLIKHCIVQGNLLKRITDRINKIFGPMLLIYIWLIVILLGLLMYIVYERNGNSSNNLKYVIILVCLVIVIFVFYVIPAQLLTNENLNFQINEMFDSIYCTNWYECSLPMKKSLLMLLTKRRADSVIAAFGKLVEINFRTCTTMFRTGFSVFTFLIHMKNPK